MQKDETVQYLIDKSAACRQVGQTGANAESSRSHSIMQFSLKQRTADGAAGGREVRAPQTKSTKTCSVL